MFVLLPSFVQSNLNEPNSHSHHCVMFVFVQSVKSIHTESETDCVSDERYASERKFALQHLNSSFTCIRCTHIHRPNFRTHHGCMGVWVKNHQHSRFPHHAKNAAQIFVLVCIEIGQQRTAARQISPTRCRFELLARRDAGGGQNAAVGRFKRSCSVRVRKATQQYTHSSKYTTKENA